MVMASSTNPSLYPSNQIPDGGEYSFIVAEHLPFVLFSFFIVLVNTFVILLFVFKRNLRNPINYLFVSLSVSDLLAGLIGLPMVLVCSTTPDCISCFVSETFVKFTSISTLLHIVAITYERYAKIVFPLRVYRIGRASFERKVVAIIWCISSVVSLVPYSWLPVTSEACFEAETDSVAEKNKIFNIVFVTVFVALPLLLLLFADVSVFFVVRRQLDKIDGTSIGSERWNHVRKESKVIALIAVMAVYFAVSWSFYYTAIIIHSIGEEFLIPEWLHKAVYYIRFTTPLVNPMLYVLLKRDFRRAIGLKIRTLTGKHSGSNLAVRYSNDTATICQTNTRNQLNTASRHSVSVGETRNKERSGLLS